MTSKEALKKETNKIISNQCPYCGSVNIQFMYGTSLMSSYEYRWSSHYMCKDCHKEFDV